jgi:hypothetical protein
VVGWVNDLYTKKAKRATYKIMNTMAAGSDSMPRALAKLMADDILARQLSAQRALRKKGVRTVFGAAAFSKGLSLLKIDDGRCIGIAAVIRVNILLSSKKMTYCRRDFFSWMKEMT